MIVAISKLIERKKKFQRILPTQPVLLCAWYFHHDDAIGNHQFMWKKEEKASKDKMKFPVKIYSKTRDYENANPKKNM